MHQGIDSIEHSQNCWVILDKKRLKIHFPDKECPTGGLLFELEDVDGVVSRNLDNSYLGRRQPLSRSLGDRIKQIIHNPVEHFHQEWKFVQDPTVDVVWPAGRVSGFDSNAVHIFGLWMKFVGDMGIAVL